MIAAALLLLHIRHAGSCYLLVSRRRLAMYDVAYGLLNCSESKAAIQLKLMTM